MSRQRTMHVSRRRVLALGGGLTLGLLAACGPDNSPAPPSAPASKAAPATVAASTTAPTLRLGFQPPYIAVFAMQNQKLLDAQFEGAPPTIEYRRLLSLNPIVEAVTGGALDLGMGGTPLPALANGRPIRILALIERSPKTHAILIRPDSPITSPKDLQGKKLATPTGKATVFPQRVLQRAGVKDSEVDWVTLENNEGRAALLTGGIDAWATWDPFYASAEFEKQAVALVDGDTYHTNYVTLFGNADYVEAYPDTVRRFVLAYRQALTWVEANRADAVRIFADENRIDPAVAELTLSRRSYRLTPPNDEYLADVTDQGKFFVQLGVTQQEPDWATAIAPSIATLALGG